MMRMQWQPSASMLTLQKRARYLADIRAFFQQHGVMEVDVPVMAPATVTDPNIESFVVLSPLDKRENYFLMTSPEFYMKRLLVAGSGPVYYLGRAFRAGDSGLRHRPEFMMLEWYRPGWTLLQLMDEVAGLVAGFVAGDVRSISYRQAFLDHAAIDPHKATLEELAGLARRKLSPAFDSDERGVWLDLLFSHLVEPQLAGKVFVTGFPAAQAALAQTTLDCHGETVAARFELYIDGIEIANGYQEELDPHVLEERFRRDLAMRAARGQSLPEPDRCFLEAMRSGMPPCAGVALGVDRLFLCMQRASSIAEVMPFA